MNTVFILNHTNTFFDQQLMKIRAKGDMEFAMLSFLLRVISILTVKVNTLTFRFAPASCENAQENLSTKLRNHMHHCDHGREKNEKANEIDTVLLYRLKS